MLRSLLFPSVLFLACLSAGAASTSLPEGDGQAESVVRHPQVGVCTHLRKWDNEEIIGHLARSGVTWIRDDFFWKSIEKEKGVYQLPESYSKWLDLAHRAGLKVVAIFNGSNPLYAPDIYDPKAFSKAAAEFARLTRGKVDVIEILNEPANFGFSKHYGGQWNGMESDGSESAWVKKYVDLLNGAAVAIKKVNPEVKVIGLGSVTPVNFRQLAKGIAPEVDGMVDHPYSFRLVPEQIPFSDSEVIRARDGIVTADAQGTFASQIRLYREQAAKHTGPRELWLTEWGWPTYHEAKAGGMYPGVTESTQAKYILRRLFLSLGLGVDYTFVYDFVDDGKSPYDAEHHFGLLDADLKPKPSFHAVKRFTELMAPFRPAASPLDVKVFQITNRPDAHPITWDGAPFQAPGKVMVQQFQADGGRMLVAFWSGERASGELHPLLADIEIRSDEPVLKVSRTDMMTGNREAVEFENREGRILVQKTPIPDYPIVFEIN